MNHLRPPDKKQSKFSLIGGFFWAYPCQLSAEFIDCLDFSLSVRFCSQKRNKDKKKNGFTLLILSDRATKGTGLANEKIMSILVACIMCTINGKIIQRPEQKAAEKRNDKTDRAKGWKINSPEQQRNNAKDPEGYKGQYAPRPGPKRVPAGCQIKKKFVSYVSYGLCAFVPQ